MYLLYILLPHHELVGKGGWPKENKFGNIHRLNNMALI